MPRGNEHRAAGCACEAFETALLAERVAARTASYFGRDWRDPPEDLMPYELWEEAVKLFPHSIQRELSDPEADEDDVGHGRGEITAKLMSEVPLSEDSGISLSAIRTIVSDADGDGPYSVDASKLDYTLWVDRKDWVGDSVAKLRGHLHQFQNTLKERDPAGYERYVAK